MQKSETTDSSALNRRIAEKGINIQGNMEELLVKNCNIGKLIKFLRSTGLFEDI